MSEQFLEGEIVEVCEEENFRMGKLRVGGAITKVVLNLVPNAQVGDWVLVHAGVAISQIEADRQGED